MPTFRVLYRRTFSYAPYETQVIELDYSEESNLSKAAAQQEMRKAYLDLAYIGDCLMVDALKKGKK